MFILLFDEMWQLVDSMFDYFADFLGPEPSFELDYYCRALQAATPPFPPFPPFLAHLLLLGTAGGHGAWLRGRALSEAPSRHFL